MTQTNMTTASDRLLSKLSEACKQYAEAFEAEAEAQVKLLFDKEELRLAENTCVLARALNGTLGKNEIERRANLDNDCSNERDRMIQSEADLIRQTARRAAWGVRFDTTRQFLADKHSSVTKDAIESVWSTKGEPS